MEAINFTQKPEGATHFLRYASGHVVWCCVTEGGPNGQPMVSEWDSFNNYWVPCIHTMAHHQAIGMVEIVEGVETTAQPAQRPSEAPNGATHRYDHACTTAWYREVDGKLFVWRDGSWHGAVYKSTEELVKSCMQGRVTLLAMEQAEPVEDDLTWLVRESRGEWFGNSTHIARDGDLLTWATFPRLPEGYQWFTNEQYLARRAELQNKPSWEDAPAWATALTQDSAMEDGLGAWWWHEFAPTECERTWGSQGPAYPAKKRGEVLGDWRDTLEQRPADLSESAVTERLTEATKTVLAAAPALMDEKFSFDRNDWFERGELPPAGTKCEFCNSDDEWTDWHHCIFVGKDAHGAGVISIIGDDAGMLYRSGNPKDFRPIRTERDELMDAIVSQGFLSRDGGVCGQIADAILAAGFKRDGGVA